MPHMTRLGDKQRQCLRTSLTAALSAPSSSVTVALRKPSNPSMGRYSLLWAALTIFFSACALCGKGATWLQSMVNLTSTVCGVESLCLVAVTVLDQSLCLMVRHPTPPSCDRTEAAQYLNTWRIP